MITGALTVFGALLPVADGWHHDGWGGPWFLLFPLFWVIVIIGIIWIVRGAPPWRRSRSVPRVESGIDVLERRFAEGGMSADEYRERRTVLEERRSRGED